LLAAARRLGKELARLRTGEEEPAPERTREATRDVIAHCIYGVDKNPLAVDLCRVALWLESHTGGKPLTFLDHRVRCGDSLIGVFDLGVLVQGIPDKAFEALEGDDKTAARQLARRNRDERGGQHDLFAWSPGAALADLTRGSREMDTITDDTRHSLLASFPTPRDAVAYIMDTFPIVQRKDEAVFGEYRTKRVILEIYDAMQHAIATGVPYETRLDPPPAAWRTRRTERGPPWSLPEFCLSAGSRSRARLSGTRPAFRS
jgi:hypothetical protein